MQAAGELGVPGQRSTGAGTVGSGGLAVDLSVVVPVNARGDLNNVRSLLADLSRYEGSAQVETILVVNNYAEADPPAEIQEFQRLGVRVLAIPSVRRPDRPGEAVCLSARIPGVREAKSNLVVLFDADCRIPHVTELLEWYRSQFRRGARACYTSVNFYDLPAGASLHVQLAIHHGSRWFKRNVLGIPTTRGSNYAVDRDIMLGLYERGFLADDFNVGPAFKKAGYPVTYSGRRQLTVYTSGRMYKAGWKQILPYYWYRLRYNLRVLPVRPNAHRYTHRERADPKDRYTYTREGSETDGSRGE